MLLTPQWVFDDYRCVSAQFLRELGVRLLLCDLDYTLAPKSVPEPDEALHEWLRSLRDAGVTVMILSNNRSPKRVRRFCGALGIDFVGHAGKPSTRGFLRAMEKTGAAAAETAMLGDKLLTDCLGARRSGVWALTVEPKGGALGPWQKVLHAVQEPFKRRSGHDERSGRQ